MNVGCYIILTPRLGGTISNKRYIIYSTGLEWLTNCCSASFVAKSGSLPPWMVLIFSCESSNTLYYWISDKLRKLVDSFISYRTYSERENQRVYVAVALNPLKRGLGSEQVVNGRRVFLTVCTYLQCFRSGIFNLAVQLCHYIKGWKKGGME